MSCGRDWNRRLLEAVEIDRFAAFSVLRRVVLAELARMSPRLFGGGCYSSGDQLFDLLRIADLAVTVRPSNA